LGGLAVGCVRGVCVWGGGAVWNPRTSRPNSALDFSANLLAAASALIKSGWLLSGVWYVLNADDVIMP
jgi:hypothetical protein